jgi:uncharacterized protein (TIGR02594 family)
MTDEVPPWLNVMRTLTGTKEVSGSGDNPVILGMADEIARIWEGEPGMEGIEEYCAQYTHDDIAWCGLTAGYCVSEAGYRPAYAPPPADDTDRFLWAQSVVDDDHYVELPGPVLGAIMVMTREGGGHITMVEEWGDGWVKCRGGNQSDSVNVATYDTDDVIGYYWPAAAPMPEVPRRNLAMGDEGTDVVQLQKTLGVYPADGDFGSITDAAVKGYQAACSISVDGEVGPQTWGKLDELDAKVAAGNDGLAPELIDAIVETAENSAIARYNWKDRGQAPLGYTAGVALCFAQALDRLNSEEDIAWEMAKKNSGNEDKDVLAWYEEQFDDAGMDNSEDGADTLRHLFALMLGLGLRESSGRYCEGRDQSASNVSSDTAEAGMYQTSWNIRSCDATIPPMLSEFWHNPCGFRTYFQKGVTLKSSDLGNYGSGQGAQYQFLSKYAPVFHALVTGVGLRNLRQHWGPINREEVELKEEADQMLQAVQALVEEGVEPPGPEPEPDQPRVDITAKRTAGITEIVITGGDVYVTVNGEPWEGA